MGLPTATFAQDAEWVEVSEVYAESPVFVKKVDEYSAWVKYVGTRIPYFPENSSEPIYVNGYILSLQELDCATQTTGMLELGVYEASGNCLSHYVINESDPDLEEVQPGTPPELYLNYFCSLTKK